MLLKRTLLLLCAFCTLILGGCVKKVSFLHGKDLTVPTDEIITGSNEDIVFPVEMPSDFTFSLHWGIHGYSSYNSADGKLLKTSDTNTPENYETTYYFTEAQMREIWASFVELDPSRYPRVYDPNPSKESYPYVSLILEIRFGESLALINSEDITGAQQSNDPLGTLFYDTCYAIIDILTASDEWNALPDVENRYL